MLVSDKILAAFNEQVGHELGAANQYTSIAGYFEGQSLGGLARFFYAQSDEEREHAMKFVKFIVEAGGRLAIPAIPAPKADFAGAAEAVELALESEKRVTAQIYALVEGAKAESNYIALRFLDWFVEEQFEEVTSMEGLLQVVKMAGRDRLLAVEEHLEREGKLPESPAE